MENWPNTSGLFNGPPTFHIRKACDASLKRLQIDPIDL
jgi:aryl-alcohol dehydrogenase-like predicted oxidoreductase